MCISEHMLAVTSSMTRSLPLAVLTSSITASAPAHRGVDCCSHLAHSMIQSHKYRAGDDVMANIEFGDLAHAGHRAHIAISESVSSRDVQAVLGRERRGFAQASKFLIGA